MSERLSYDPPKLTQDEATELCVYHLRCAAALFQLVPDDNNESLLIEMHRQTEGDLIDIDRIPMVKWASVILKAYEEMKDRD